MPSALSSQKEGFGVAVRLVGAADVSLAMGCMELFIIRACLYICPFVRTADSVCWSLLLCVELCGSSAHGPLWQRDLCESDSPPI